jgi:hypothetical protein
MIHQHLQIRFLVTLPGLSVCYRTMSDPIQPVIFGAAEGSIVRCPVCQNAKAVLHSELDLPIGKRMEKTGIFVCPASHAFIVPYCSLGLEPPKSRRRVSAAIRKQNSRRVGSPQMQELCLNFCSLLDDSWRLVAQLRSELAQLEANRRQLVRAIRQCRATGQFGRNPSRTPRTPVPKNYYGLPLQ